MADRRSVHDRGETGVVAYRDYYQPGSDRMLERSITDYLTTHNLVKAA